MCTPLVSGMMDCSDGLSIYWKEQNGSNTVPMEADHLFEYIME